MLGCRPMNTSDGSPQPTNASMVSGCPPTPSTVTRVTLSPMFISRLSRPSARLPHPKSCVRPGRGRLDGYRREPAKPQASPRKGPRGPLVPRDRVIEHNDAAVPADRPRDRGQAIGEVTPVRFRPVQVERERGLTLIH